MASFIHDIYTGMEKLIESLIKYYDGQLPVGEEWHRKLLMRAKFANDEVRPPVISEETYMMLDELRSFRHAFRSIYVSNLIPQRANELAGRTLMAFKAFDEDVRKFIEDTRQAITNQLPNDPGQAAKKAELGAETGRHRKAVRNLLA